MKRREGGWPDDVVGRCQLVRSMAIRPALARLYFENRDGLVTDYACVGLLAMQCPKFNFRLLQFIA